jgi:hypothetical protein
MVDACLSRLQQLGRHLSTSQQTCLVILEACLTARAESQTGCIKRTVANACLV